MMTTLSQDTGRPGNVSQAFLRLWCGLQKVNIYGFGVRAFWSRYFMASCTHLFLGSAQISLACLVLKLWERGEAMKRILFENCTRLTPKFSGPSAMGWIGACCGREGRGQRKDGTVSISCCSWWPNQAILVLGSRELVWSEQTSRQGAKKESVLLWRFMDWMVEVELSEFMTPSNSNAVLDLCPLRMNFWTGRGCALFTYITAFWGHLLLVILL